ncbi:sn-1,2-diacylglycerol cholinephosphotransferase [Coccidioides immitis H538.4]|uniref:sn-1,2-diacylglycerol cholinephosphotransferase n=1 Tax=Coccidioides immitis H538.4 TaxID=396776 RepID=A0A0J8UXL1_COCIT|nr:sn-1,2-diacylglycerol cholinephosphotransferase [Coccidioides immitis H538.4]
MIPNQEMTRFPDSLSDEILSPLKTYKYSSIDKSFISRYILKHYWNAFVELLPLWLAPNMVTLIGFMFIIGNLLVLEVFVPDLVGPAPPWVYYSFALGLWMYSTMDNVDGKQARRTGTSSGLGELFENETLIHKCPSHGIDSLNCTLASLLEAAAMGQGSSKIGAFTTLIPCLPMFFSTWETFPSHYIIFGFISIVQPTGFDYCHPVLADYSFLDLWVVVLLGSFLIAHLPACILNVIRSRKRRNLPILPVFLEWTPIVVSSISTIAWLYSPHSTLLRENHLVLFAVTISFVFGRMTTKIILAHLTRQSFPFWTMLMAPLLGGAFLGNLPRFGLPMVNKDFEAWYLRAYLVIAFVTYMHWAFFVIHRITTFLDINCLTIRKDSLAASKGLYQQISEGTRDILDSQFDLESGRLKNH